MKTTLFGLAAQAADFAMLCVDAPSGVGTYGSILDRTRSFAHDTHRTLVDTTREHFSCAITLDVPVFVVINKIDLCSKSSIQQTVTCLTYLLKHGHGSFQLDPYVVQREEDLVKAADMFVEKRFAAMILSADDDIRLF